MSHKHLNTIPRQDASDENSRFRGLILTGRAGIGKTSALMSMVLEGDQFCRIPMASRTAEDFGVIPVPDKVERTTADGSKVMTWEIAQPLIEAQLKPFLEDTIGDGYGVVLLDDVTLGDPRLQSGLLELVQFGRIGDFQLGKNVLIAMTGNGIDDMCSAVEWNKALLGRSMLVEYEPDFDTWMDLPCNRSIDASVAGFLKAFPGFFAPSADDDKAADENGKVPSPRDWTSLGTELAFKHGSCRDFKGSFLFPSLGKFVSAMIGKKASNAFMSFVSIIMKYPSAEEILNKPDIWKKVPEEDRNNKGAVYAIAHAIRSTTLGLNDKINKEGNPKSKASQEKKRELVKKFCHAVAVLMENNREMGAFCIRYLLAQTDKEDEIGGFLADVCYNVNDIDPVLKNAGLNKVMEDIKKTSAALSR
jgi:hypothetical protein